MGSGSAEPMPAIDVPAGACDCHTHIFGDLQAFPLSPARTYTPEPALPSELASFHRSLGIARVVIVTPSVYGAENAATVWGIRSLGDAARGVAVIDDRTTERELEELDAAGIRGIRCNLGSAGVSEPALGRQQLRAAIDRVHSRNWHVQVFTNLAMIAAMADLIAQSPIPIVIDHFGGAVADRGVHQPGFADLLELVRSGRAYVKISAAYRISRRPPDYDDVAPLAQALIEANPDRILWGTDWPHPNSAPPPGNPLAEALPPLPIDDRRLLNQLAVWAPDAELRRTILVTNPARLYGF